MANTPTVYVICDKNCRFEGMTKEQIYAAIVQAVNEGTIGDIDTGFITTIKTINGLPLRFFVGEKSAYDELTAEQKKDLFAIITNDTTKDGINEAIKLLDTNLKELKEGLEKGTIVSAKAKSLSLTETSYSVTSSGQTSADVPLVAGKNYIIWIKAVRNSAYEWETMFLHCLPKANNTFSFSTKSAHGYYVRTNGENSKISIINENGEFYQPYDGKIYISGI